MKIRDSNEYNKIHRNNIFQDVYYAIMNRTPQDLKKRLKIKYEGEEVLNAEGLLKYFFFFFFEFYFFL